MEGSLHASSCSMACPCVGSLSLQKTPGGRDQVYHHLTAKEAKWLSQSHTGHEREEMWDLTAETAHKATALCLLSCFHFSFPCFKECVIFLHIDQKPLCVTCCILHPLLQESSTANEEIMSGQIFHQPYVYKHQHHPSVTCLLTTSTHLSVIYQFIICLHHTHRLPACILPFIMYFIYQMSTCL